MEKQIQAVLRVKDVLPTYHTRAMRQHFIELYAKCTATQPAILRDMYSYLTNDQSAACNEQDRQIQMRVAEFLLRSDNEGPIIDLRANNGRIKDPKFDPFWTELGKHLEEVRAVNERRTNAVLHMSFALSVEDLIVQIQNRLPANTPVPSTSWVKLNFNPSNPYLQSAANYTGQFKIKRSIQQRLLRAQHVDAGYCYHLFHMMKDMAVKWRDNAQFICVDDKAVVPIG